jgi:hypothetical protein
MAKREPMTTADEARCIAIRQDGTEIAEIARQLGILRSTMSIRAAALVRQGKIQLRPRGGAHPMQRQQAALSGVSPDISRVSGRVSANSQPTAG